MFKGRTLKIITIIVITAILGEFRINPFDTPFRFGLGSAGFFLLLLLYKDIPYRLTGLLTGIFTTLFRVSLDFVRLDSFTILESLQVHSPIIGYYFIFALALHMMKERGFFQNPIWLGLYGAFCDAFSNFVEVMIISFSTGSLVFNTVNTTYILVVAMIRSFFVVGLYTMFQTNKLNAVYQEQRRRFEQVQTILSEMYIEVFYLKKTLHEIEEVTAKGHRLYRNLKDEGLPKELSIVALSLTQELHEVKKDNQRILAGLEKVLHHEKNIIPVHLADIIDLGIKSNEKWLFAKFYWYTRFKQEYKSTKPSQHLLGFHISNCQSRKPLDRQFEI